MNSVFTPMFTEPVPHSIGGKLRAVIRPDEVRRTLLNATVLGNVAHHLSIIEVASLVATDRKRLLLSPKASPTSYRLFEMLPMMPRFTIEHVRHQLDTSFPTASTAVKSLQDANIVTEMTGQKKNRSYSYQAYTDLLAR